MAQPYLYTHDDGTSVEVLVDGQWCPAELRMRTQHADGYRYNAAWTRDGQTRLDTFHQDHIRADTVDRSEDRVSCALGAPAAPTEADSSDTPDTDSCRSAPYAASDLRGEHP